MAVQATATMTITNQAGKTSTKALTHIDPNAEHYKIRQFAEGLNSLTNNTLNKVELVTREDVSNAFKPTTVTPGSLLAANVSGGNVVTFTVDYEGEDRNFTWSGQKLRDTVITKVDAHTFKMQTTFDSIVFTYGEDSAEMTITVEAGINVPETTATITFTNGNASDFRDI